MTNNDESSTTSRNEKLVITPELPVYGSTHHQQYHHNPSPNDCSNSNLTPTSDSSPVTPGHISARPVLVAKAARTSTSTDASPLARGAATTIMATPSTTHNDPSLRSLLQTEHLRGSTRMLKAYYQNTPPRPPQQQQQQHRRRWSSGNVLPIDTLPLIETDDEDESFGNGGGDFNHNNQNDNNNQHHYQSILGTKAFPPLPKLGGGDGGPNLSDDEEEPFVSIHQAHRNKSITYSIGASVRGIVGHINGGFFQDARSLAEGTIPQSIVLSFIIGIVCGIAAYLYYTCLFFLLDYCWHVIPETYVKPHIPQQYWWIYTPVVSFFFAILVGLSVKWLGEPGDLAFAISCIHKQAYIPMNHTIPMFCASLFSILAGGSLGPEAPLVAICGALGGFVSRHLFGQNNVHVVRKHTLMGMAGALSAFFGCPLGGSLFAVEVNSRFGIEYFEHMVEAIFAGEITLVVFRSLSGLSIGPIWNLTQDNDGHYMQESAPWMVVAGGCIGLMGAGMAYVFALFHWAQMGLFDKLGLLDNSRAVYRAMLGCCVISGVGLLIPHTMFWGEEEFQVIASMSPASELPFVWPPTGLIGFENDSAYKSLLIGLAKMITISYTVVSGFRGGYIFPLILSGSAFGRALYTACPFLPLPVAVLSFSAGMNVAITRTSLATTIILSFLSGEPYATPAILSASLCSLFATAYVPFIKTQITRSDIDHSMFHQKRIVTRRIHGDE